MKLHSGGALIGFICLAGVLGIFIGFCIVMAVMR
jgi:hypothetical protein